MAKSKPRPKYNGKHKVHVVWNRNDGPQAKNEKVLAAAAKTYSEKRPFRTFTQWLTPQCIYWNVLIMKIWLQVEFNEIL